MDSTGYVGIDQREGVAPEADAAPLGARRPASPWLVAFARKAGLLDHGQTVRLQFGPCGWRLAYGVDHFYDWCPFGRDPLTWLADLARRHRTFERTEKRAGRGPLSARQRVVRPARQTCQPRRGPSRAAHRIRTVRRARARAPGRSSDGPEQPLAKRGPGQGRTDVALVPGSQ
jgi:hypothetical protein